MTVEEALTIIEQALEQRYLTKIQELVFRQAWEGHSYTEIAKTTGYDPDYIKDIGSRLWQMLSQAFGEKVTKFNFQSVLKRSARRGSREIEDQANREKIQSFEFTTNSRIDWGEAPDVSTFYGREQELAVLEQWILQEKCRLVALLGVGGIGKTALFVKLADQIKDKFEYVVWRSLRNSPPLNQILTELIEFLSDQQEVRLPVGSTDLVPCFLNYLRQYRCLVVLDNCESILQEGACAGEYRSGCKEYGYFLKCIGETFHRSCVILTSREKPNELDQIEDLKSPVRSLRLNGLGEVEGYKVFVTKGYSGSESELKPLIKRCSGNPLALKVIATTLQDLFDNNVAEFLKQETILFGDIWKLLSEQFNRLSDVETQVMYWLAVEREWSSFQALRADIFPRVTSRELLEALESLLRRSVLEKRPSSFTQQPVIMEYMTNQLVEQVFQEIKTGQISLLNRIALIKAQSRDFVRESQVRLILNPLIKELQEYFRTPDNVRQRLDALLQKVRSEDELKLGYAAGNLFNLYRYLNLSLAKYNFSGLVIRQAFLQDMDLHDVNFSHAEFIQSSFTQTFGGILSILFSPDGQILATSDTNCEIQVWRVADRQCLLTLQGHSNWVRRISFNPDGTLLASASDDGTLKIWDLSEGTCKRVLTGHTDSVYSVAFSPDGQFIASAGNDSSIRFWSVTNGTCLFVLEGHTAGILCANFSPCGKLLASGSFDNTIRIWDVHARTCLHTLTEHSNWVTGLNFSPDGQWLASPSCDRTIRVWRVADWQCTKVLQGHTGWVWGIAWSPDSQLIASFSADCTAKIWNAITGECLRTLGGHTIQIWRAVFSPDGRIIATGSEDQTIALWDVENGRRITTLIGYSNWSRPIASSPNAQVFATGHKDKALRIWNSLDNQCLQELRAHSTGISSLAFHPSSELIASGGQDAIVKIWSWQQGKCVAVFKGHTNEVWGLAFNRNGQILASSSFDHTIKLWCLKDKVCLSTLVEHSDRVSTLAFHPDGEILASGSDDCTIKLWSVSNGDCYATLTGHNGRVGTVSFSPNGNLLVSASLDQTVKIWNVQSGKCLQTLQGHQNWVMGAVFFPDNQTVVSASCDRSLKIWDSHTGQCLNTLKGHTNWIWAVAISPDGQKLISASEDGTVRIWNLQGNCLAVLKPKLPYQGMQIGGVTGINPAQELMLRKLGAV